MDSVDLQQFHVWYPGLLARDEFKRAFEDLRTSGKVRFFGVSINDHQPDTALVLVASGLFATVQVIYNIFDRSPEAKLFSAVQQHNVGVLARVQLVEGALTGTISDGTMFDK